MKAFSFLEPFYTNSLQTTEIKKKTVFFFILYFLVYVLKSLAERKLGLAGLTVSEDAKKKRIPGGELYILLLSAVECFLLRAVIPHKESLEGPSGVYGQH